MAQQRPLIPDVSHLYQWMDDGNALLSFRFTSEDILTIVQHSRLPLDIRTAHRDRCGAFEAVCLTLLRLSFPTRLHTIQLLVGRSYTAICRIVLHTIEALYQLHGGLLRLSEHYHTHDKLREFANAISLASDGVVPSIWGFVDGTLIRICRPVRGQRPFYSGRIRQHCLNYPALVSPDGMLYVYPPSPGSRHDSAILRLSGLHNDIQRVALGTDLFIYGDGGYPNTNVILRPFRNPDEDQLVFNRTMSNLRASVEWSFHWWKTLSTQLMLRGQQRVLLSPLGQIHMVSAFFHNLHNCIYRNQVSKRFDMVPPTVAEYLHRL